MLAACAQTNTAVPAHAAAALSQADQNRALCLAEPKGAGSVDAMLRLAQKPANERARAEDFVAAGRQWVRKARLASDPGFYLNVDGCVELALAAEPGHVGALELRSLTLMNAHRFGEARDLAQRILAQEPENVTALGTLSDALLELGRYDEATRAAQRQMDVHPGMAAAARGSYLRWLVGDDKRAKLLIREALIGRDAADPEPTAWVLTEAGNLYWHGGDRSGADALYTEALRWVKEYPAALVGRGRVALAQDQTETAIEYFKLALRAKPSVESAWLLGDAYTLRGDAELANAAYAQAETLGRRGDKLTLAQFLLAKAREPERALKLIEEERATRGGVYVDDTYAFALFRNGRFDAARDLSADVLKVGTPDARILYHAGVIRRACGERTAGNALLEKALALNAAFDRDAAREARALLGDASTALAGR